MLSAAVMVALMLSASSGRARRADCSRLSYGARSERDQRRYVRDVIGCYHTGERTRDGELRVISWCEQRRDHAVWSGLCREVAARRHRSGQRFSDHYRDPTCGQLSFQSGDPVSQRVMVRRAVRCYDFGLRNYGAEALAMRWCNLYEFGHDRDDATRWRNVCRKVNRRKSVVYFGDFGD